MIKKRALVVLLSVVVIMLATIAPAGATDPAEVVVTITMPNGSVQVIDHIFDIVVVQTIGGGVELQFTLASGKVSIFGDPGTVLEVFHPDGGDGGGICIPGEDCGPPVP